jgi:peroxiredoxin
MVFLLAALAAGFLTAAEIPRPAKDFKFQLASGRQTSLSEYKGKAIVLEFLLTTCSHCQKCSQIMQKLSNEFAPKGVQMLGVAIGEGDDKKFQMYAQQFGITYPIGYHLNRAQLGEFLQHPVMEQMMMPQLVFIDRTGVIRAQFRGNDETFFGPANDKGGTEQKSMRAEILKLVAPSAAAKAPAKKAPARKTI